ncbi:ArsA-related P-loop ATPase [Vibrio parahaemolyticus]|nr:ArsA-related P-loop ATPase [Vibrio parahaemolyticus]
MSNIHFFLQGKGGVGKTLTSSFTTQYLSSISNDVVCIDTDSVNHTFSQYAAFNAIEYNIYDPETSFLDETVIEKMAEFIYEATNEHIVIDNGASSFMPLLQYLIDNQIIEALNEAGHQVYIHTVITGGQGLEDTAAGLSSVLESFQQVSVVAWLNYKFGDILMDGKMFREWPLYKKNKEAIVGIIPIDFHASQLFQNDLEAMLGSKQTFDEAMASVKLFSRNRLKQMKEQVFNAIADTQLPCFLPSEEETAQ